jgi:phosphatidylinositol alpha-1,6-mannosyltransferase
MYLKNLLDAYDGETLVVAPSDDRVDGPEVGIVRGTRPYMLPDRATRRLVRDAGTAFRPDAILFGAPHPLPWMGPWLREELGVPFGILSHGAEITIPGSVPGAKQALGRALAAADVRFAVSRFTARKVEALSHRRVEFLGAGVEVETFTPPTSPPDNPVPVVGCVSRFVPRKGQDRLLRAVASLDRDVEVLFVGTGRTEQDIRKLADELGVRARFEVDVPWSELPGFYQSMDIFCMPCSSRWGGLEVEGLGLVFLEAASTAIPVLAGDSGGSPETVIPGETGFVVSSVPDIVEGLELLLANPSQAAQMGMRGREFVMREFTWERVVERLYGGFAPHIG